MLGTIKRLWKESFLFFLSTLIIIFLILSFFIFPRLPKVINACNALPAIVFSLIPIAIIAMVIGAIIIGLIIAAFNLKDNKVGKFKLIGPDGIIRDVPANHIWVLRKALISNPGDKDHEPEGYVQKSEGWSYYIPVWHIDMGFVNLAPEPHDPNPTTVNTSDSKTVNIDWRRETYVFDPIRYVVRVRTGKDKPREQVRQDIEAQVAKVIFAEQCSEETQEDLIKFGKDEETEEDKLKEFGERAMREFNKRMDFYGIQARDLSVQKILPPQDIIDAAEYETVTKLRRKVAGEKGLELKEIIDKTGASPTVTVAADIVRGVLGDLISPFIDRLNKKGDNNGNK